MHYLNIIYVIYFESSLDTMHNFNYAPITLAVQS
jgi:hypothetical protein